MTRRLLLSLASGIAALTLGLGGAQAGQIPITPTPANLDTLIGDPPPSGPFARVGNLEFSNFTYTLHGTTQPPASQVTVGQVLGLPSSGFQGLQFGGIFFAPAGSLVDYSITYDVRALTGTTISGAYLQITGGVNPDTPPSTGFISVDETINGVVGPSIFVTQGSLPRSNEFTFTTPQTLLKVEKDIMINGGSNGAQVSIIDQTFGTGTGAVPEPVSMALLGIGLSGLFTFRRFFKRAFAA